MSPVRPRSWVESANSESSDFPLENLPFGVFGTAGDSASATVGARIGDAIVDIVAAADRGLLDAATAEALTACRSTTLNALMALDRVHLRSLRDALAALLDASTDTGRRAAAGRDRFLVDVGDVEMRMPAAIGDYSDFYASIDHASNVGSMFRPDNPLLPNYKYVPIGYHGRASSIVPSGTAIHRPSGQTRNDPAQPPAFGPSRRLDYELEIGAFIAGENALGRAVPIERAEERIFGLCLVNDWSARDIQTWEYQPLGPFLAKSFATSISPWVVTLDALEPFRCPAYERPSGDPAPLAYLDSPVDRRRGGFDITLEVLLWTPAMREAVQPPQVVSRGSFSAMYWTLAQMVAHHASNGCNLRPGDLIASGTVSGPSPESRGCLLERTWRGTEPLVLPTGEKRTFLEAGDEVIIRGHCSRAGQPRVGFGECRGLIID